MTIKINFAVLLFTLEVTLDYAISGTQYQSILNTNDFLQTYTAYVVQYDGLNVATGYAGITFFSYLPQVCNVPRFCDFQNP